MNINTTGNLPRGQNGFTLAEAMMAMVVLGIAAAGVLLPFSNGANVRAEGLRSTLGSRLAGDLIEHIVNTGNYGDYSEAQGHIISDFDTNAEFTDPIYANFSRTASCKYWPDPQLSSVFILVTAQVLYNGRPIAAVNRLINE